MKVEVFHDGTRILALCAGNASPEISAPSVVFDVQSEVRIDDFEMVGGKPVMKPVKKLRRFGEART